MHVRNTGLAAATVALALAGCAKQQTEVPFDHALAGGVKTIAVIGPAVPEHANVILATSVGQNLPGVLGIFGVMVDAGLQSARDDKVAAMVAQEHFAAADSFEQALEKQLIAEGYQVIQAGDKSPRPKFLDDYPASAADANLDIAILNYGYVALGTSDSAPYRPFVQLRARLVDAHSKSILMQNIVSYYPLTGIPGVALQPDPKYTYTNFDELTGAGAHEVVAGMQTALTSTAEATAKLVQ